MTALLDGFMIDLAGKKSIQRLQALSAEKDEGPIEHVDGFYIPNRSSIMQINRTLSAVSARAQVLDLFLSRML